MPFDEEDLDEHGECAARIHALENALNRIANACRIPSDDFQRAMLKVSTEALGDAYKPLPLKMPR